MLDQLNDYTSPQPNPPLSVDRLVHIQRRIAELSEPFIPPTLIAISKTFESADIWPILTAGQRSFGENRVQEAAKKWPELRNRAISVLGAELDLHLVGPLQSNKAKQALETFNVIQTLDNLRLVDRLANEEQKLRRHEMRYYVQVNVDNELQKAGVGLDDVGELIALCRQAFGARFRGLMCIPAALGDSREAFQTMSRLADHYGLPDRSMGMSDSFECAIRSGSTHLRIGRAIFGTRPESDPSY